MPPGQAVSNGKIDCTLLYVMPLKFEKPYRAMSVNNSLQIVADDNNKAGRQAGRAGGQTGSWK